MSESNGVTIWDLFKREGEPFDLGDDQGRSVKVKLLKRTEQQRRDAIKHALEMTKEREAGKAGRLEVILATHPVLQQTKQNIVDFLVNIYRLREIANGLDRYDPVEFEEADAPRSEEELKQQREEHLQEYLDQERARLESKDESELRAEAAEIAWRGEINMDQAAHMNDMSIVQTLVYAESGDKVFESLENFYGLQEETCDILRDKVSVFLRGEQEPEARKAATDPNSPKPAE